jgi:hypothetical protein
VSRGRLVCNIDDAIGAYGVSIWSPLSALIFRVILIVGRNRVALMGGTILLLAPAVVVFSLGTVRRRALRKLLVRVVPTCVTRLAQALVLRSQLLDNDQLAAAVAESSAPRPDARFKSSAPGPAATSPCLAIPKA